MPKAVEIALRECFHPKEGKPDLRKIPVNIERAKQHIDKAHSNLRAMKIMFDNNWAIICGYYAMYHAVLASLFRIGIRATAHYCAIAAFKKFYVERGKVKPENMSVILKRQSSSSKSMQKL